MEAFERELGDMSIGKPKKKKEVKIADDEEEEDVPDGADFEDIDETELGDNPFAMGGGGGGIGAGSADTEAWLGSDRDYTYQEVSPSFLSLCWNGHKRISHSSSIASSARSTQRILLSRSPVQSGTPSPHPQSTGTATNAPYSPTSVISAGACTDSPSMSSRLCSRRWARRAAWMAAGGWSFEVDSSRNRLRIS